MEIPNYDSGDNPDKKYKQLFHYMPSDTFRMLICGNSGSGKTNLLYHMLIKPLLYYDEIYLYARNLEQDKYQKLIQKMRELSSKLGYEILHVSNDEIIPVSEMDYEDNQKLVIFDDYVCDKNQRQLIDYFIQGRHKNCSVVGSPSTSRLTVDSNIDMKDTYRIQNLISPLDSKDPATKYYVDNTFLDRDGSYPMKGNLNMDNNRIFNLPAPNGSNQPTPLAFTDLKYLHVSGTNKMTNNLNMDNKGMIHLKPPTNPTDGATKKYVDDSIPNTSSFIKKDGSVSMTSNLNVGNNKIVGLATPTSNTDAATKKYVDDNAGSPDLSDYLEKDGTVTMTGNLNLGNNKIVNLSDPTTDQEAANRGWVRKQIERFDHHSGDGISSVFTITDPGAPTTLYLQYISGSSFDDFVFTTSTPGQPLVGWAPTANTYINKIEFQFGSRNINVDFLWFIPRDVSHSNSNFWVTIKNIKLDRNNDNSAATVALVKELAPFTKNALYRLYFSEFYDFDNADSYGINIGSSGIIINSLKPNITLPPNKDLSEITEKGLHINVKLDYNKSNNKVTLTVGKTTQNFTMLSSFDGKIIVVWLAEDLSANVTKVSISNYSGTLTIPAVNYNANQRLKFTTEDGVLIRLMYSPNFYDIDSEKYHKVMLQEKLNGSYIM
ncbi:unnamed protein product [Porites evermanni]|uniref:Uncharacterized protein n=1 Tax=Porites evermanni TaxID=104178 RepID=A0ABN8LHJ9_9CNID|nr:unnamed protein product [Porites evermanni]